MASDITYPAGWKELQEDSNWELVSENDQVMMYQKAISVSPIPAFKAVLHTTAKPNSLIQTAWLVEKSPEIFTDAFIKDAGIYLHHSPHFYTAFQIIDIPVLAPRLYQFTSLLTGNTIHWVSADTLASASDQDDFIIPKVNFGSWEVIKGDEENMIVYRVCTDPGGSVPAWIVNKINRKYLPKMMMDLEKYALNHSSRN